MSSLLKHVQFHFTICVIYQTETKAQTQDRDFILTGDLSRVGDNKQISKSTQLSLFWKIYTGQYVLII